MQRPGSHGLGLVGLVYVAGRVNGDGSYGLEYLIPQSLDWRQTWGHVHTHGQKEADVVEKWTHKEAREHMQAHIQVFQTERAEELVRRNRQE